MKRHEVDDVTVRLTFTSVPLSSHLRLCTSDPHYRRAVSCVCAAPSRRWLWRLVHPILHLDLHYGPCVSAALAVEGLPRVRSRPRLARRPWVLSALSASYATVACALGKGRDLLPPCHSPPAGLTSDSGLLFALSCCCFM